MECELYNVARDWWSTTMVQWCLSIFLVKQTALVAWRPDISTLFLKITWLTATAYGLKLRLSLLVVASFVSSLLLLGLETCLAWSKHCQPNWPGDMPNWHFSFRSIMLNWGNLSNSALSLLSCSVPVPCTPTWSLICCTPFRPSAILWMCSWFSLLALNVPVTNL